MESTPVTQKKPIPPISTINPPITLPSKPSPFLTNKEIPNSPVYNAKNKMQMWKPPEGGDDKEWAKNFSNSSERWVVTNVNAGDRPGAVLKFTLGYIFYWYFKIIILKKYFLVLNLKFNPL